VSASIPVIINAGAGTAGGADLASRISELFLAGGVRADVRAASGSELDTLIRAAVAERPPMLVAGGGDGTISTAAAALAGSEITLGVLPLGTLNHFAKDLRIPLALEAAVQNIIRGNTTQVDIGVANDRVFINNSSLGLYPDIVLDRERQQRRLGRGKLRSLVWASIAAFRRFPFMTVTIDVRGERHRFVTPLVLIGNNEYLMQGFDIGARARLDGGKLSIYVVKRPGRIALVHLAAQALVGRLKQSRDFVGILASECVIETRHPLLAVATDGEVSTLTSPLRYRIRSRSLRVIVPGEGG
jgi:diacylglycerol kinase family enzyme